MTEFTCEAASLLKALRAVNEISTPSKETVAILKNVLFDISGNDAVLTRCNFEGAITKALKVESEGDWSFTVAGDRLAQIVGTYDNGAQVKISVTGGWAQITCGRSKVRLAMMVDSDFPRLPFDDDASEFDVGEDYIKSLAMVIHAQGADERYYLKGVHHAWIDGKLRLAASDGHQLAIVNTSGAELPDIIVPSDAVSLLVKLAPEVDKIRISATKDRARWQFGDVSITHKMVDGTFPDVAKLVRDVSPITVKVDADTLAQTIGRIMILADDKDRTAKLDVTKDKLTIESRGAGDMGADEIPCGSDGDDLTIAFRTAYLRNALNALDVDYIELGLFDARAPMMIRSPAKPEALLVIMPTT